jgi:hypothetical protein
VTTDWSRAQGISANGAYLVGLGKSGFQQPYQAFLWDALEGTRGLGWLPPEEFGRSSADPLVGIAQSYPYAVSDDGSLAVGFSSIYIQLGGMLPAAFTESLPFVWTPATGMVEANKYLIDEHDFDFPGTITRIADVSADGRVWLAGGVNSGGDEVGMVIRLDDAAAAGDFNGDGSVDGEDLALWRDHFGDGAADGADFLMWQRGANVGGSAAAVPEPAGWPMMAGAVGAAVLGACARRRTLVCALPCGGPSGRG